MCINHNNKADEDDKDDKNNKFDKDDKDDDGRMAIGMMRTIMLMVMRLACMRHKITL